MPPLRQKKTHFFCFFFETQYIEGKRKLGLEDVPEKLTYALVFPKCTKNSAFWAPVYLSV